MPEGEITQEAEAKLAGHSVLDLLLKHGAITKPEITVGGSGLQVNDNGDSIDIKRERGNTHEGIHIHSREEKGYLFARTIRNKSIKNPDNTVTNQKIEADINESPYGRRIPLDKYNFHITINNIDPDRPFGRKELKKTDVIMDFGENSQPLRVIISTFGDEGHYVGSGEMNWNSRGVMEYDDNRSRNNAGFPLERFNQVLQQVTGNELVDVQKGFKLDPKSTQEKIMDFTEADTSIGQRVVLVPNP